MNKLCLSLVFICLSVTICYSQSEKIYLDKTGNPTSKNKATYYKVIDKVASENASYLVTNYYISGAVFTEGWLKTILPEVREGLFTRYFENGKVAETGEYHDNDKSGIWKTFYENGQPKEVLRHLSLKDKSGYYIMEFWDINGVKLVTNGEGYYHSVYKNNSFAEKGKVSGGAKDSIWTGYYENGKKFYEELYNHGTFVKGTSYNQTESRTDYIKPYSEAFPMGGIDAFYNNVIANLIVPEKIRYQINTVMWVNFTVNVEGKIKNVKVLKGIEADFDQRVFSKIAYSNVKWYPAHVHGQPIEYSYTVPVILNMKGEGSRTYSAPVVNNL